MAKEPKKKVKDEDILNVITGIRNGGALVDINTKFNRMFQAVKETQQKGEITIKLTCKPSKFALGGGVREVEFSHECAIKEPEIKVGKSAFYVRDDGTLSREDPGMEDQSELPFVIEEPEEKEDA